MESTCDRTYEYEFDLDIRDFRHLDRIMIWLSENVGPCLEGWVIRCRYADPLAKRKEFIYRIVIFRKDFGPECVTFLTLL